MDAVQTNMPGYNHDINRNLTCIIKIFKLTHHLICYYLLSKCCFLLYNLTICVQKTNCLISNYIVIFNNTIHLPRIPEVLHSHIIGSRNRMPGFESWFHQSPTNCLISPCFSFLICKMGLVIIPSSEHCRKILLN